MGEKKPFTCQNPSCRRTSITPLRTLNLQENPTEPYYACPFCLTKIEEAKFNQELPEENPLQNQQEPEKKVKQKIAAKNDIKPSACRFHLGYLSERSQKEQIPEECLLCKDIVECMLKKMHET